MKLLLAGASKNPQFLPDEVTMLGEDLHPGSFVAAVADDKLATGFHHSHLHRALDMDK